MLSPGKYHCKRARSSRSGALEQVARYFDTLGLQNGWMVLVDLRKDVLWEDRRLVRLADLAGKVIRVAKR